MDEIIEGDVLRSSGVEQIEMVLEIAISRAQMSELFDGMNGAEGTVVDEGNDDSERLLPRVRRHADSNGEMHALIFILTMIAVETRRTKTPTNNRLT